MSSRRAAWWNPAITTSSMKKAGFTPAFTTCSSPRTAKRAPLLAEVVVRQDRVGAGARLGDDHRLLKVRLGAQAQGHRIARLDVGRVPVAAVAHLGNGVLGGADQLAELGVGQFRVVLQEPGDGVRLVLALGYRGVAGALGLGMSDGLSHEQAQMGRIIGFAALNLFASHLA